MRFPIRAVTVEPADVRRVSANADVELAGVKILLVDDDRDTRDVIRVVLQSAGANVIAVDSVAAAGSELAHSRPDIVVTDIAMPNVDGYQLARQIRENAGMSGVKVVALSAFSAGKALGVETDLFDQYLTKPVEPSDLIKELARIRSVS